MANTVFDTPSSDHEFSPINFVETIYLEQVEIYVNPGSVAKSLDMPPLTSPGSEFSTPMYEEELDKKDDEEDFDVDMWFKNLCDTRSTFLT